MWHLFGRRFSNSALACLNDGDHGTVVIHHVTMASVSSDPVGCFPCSIPEQCVLKCLLCDVCGGPLVWSSIP